MIGLRVSPARAFGDGLVAVMRAPLLSVAAAAVSIALTLPFAAMLGAELESALALQPPVERSETEIDAEWWRHFRAHAEGLAATFTPAVIGFAAPLDAISGVLDGRRPPLVVFGPLALSTVAWAFLWGGVLRRFAAGRAIGAGEFVRAGARFAPRFVVIALAASAAMVILYLTVHSLLFGPIYSALVSPGEGGLRQFLVRASLYAVFFAPLAFVGLVADYARIAAVSAEARSPIEALKTGARFVAANPRSVAVLYLLYGLLFVVVTIGYGVLDLSGGSLAEGWRAIAVGQAYVMLRLALRLAAAASELRLFESGTTR